jgi:hypothetical protein
VEQRKTDCANPPMQRCTNATYDVDRTGISRPRHGRR